MDETSKPIENAVEQVMTPAARAARIQQECTGCWAQFGVSAKSREFLDGIKERAPIFLSEKQEKWMRDIEMAVFGGADAEEDEDSSYRELSGKPTFKGKR